MGDTMPRSEAMKAILSLQPFTLEFVTADRRRGTGGDLITCRNWKLLSLDVPADERPGLYQEKMERKKETSNHLQKTFKIFNPARPSQHPITVHYRLMQTLNGKRLTNG